MSLAERVSAALRSQGLVLTSAESCTGGMISSAITDLAGSSDIFDRGFITYSNQSKIDLLGVYGTILDIHGAVSEQTAKAMIEGALRQTPAHIAVAVTGIAGPSGGTPDRPVGLVYIGVGFKDQSAQAFKHIFSGDRAAIRQQSVDAALTHLLDLIESRHA